MLVSDTLSVFLFTTARGTHQDNSLRPARSLRMLEFQDTVHYLFRNVLQRIVGINHSNRALVDLFDSSHVQFILSKSTLSQSKDLSMRVSLFLNFSLKVLNHLSVSFF